MASDHLETPGHPDSTKHVGDEVLFYRRPEESLCRGDRTSGVVTLVSSMKRQVHFREPPEGRPDVDQAPPDCEPIRAATEFRSPPPDRPGPDPFGLSLEDRGHVRRLFAQHEKRAALYYAGLFGCDRLPRGSKDLGVIELNVGDHGNIGVADVGRVEATPETNFSHNGLRCHVGEPGVCSRRHELEPGRPYA